MIRYSDADERNDNSGRTWSAPDQSAVVVLEPCPFCGGEACLNDYEAKYGDLPPMSRSPQCRSCGTSLGYFTTPAKAITAWNRRAAPKPTLSGERKALETVERILSGIPKPHRNDGATVSYMVGDDVPEDIVIALAHVRGALSSPLPGEPG